MTVALEEDFANLDEVIITGLATSVKRSNLANAVATLSAKELYGVAPAQTFDAALSGKIPGALITANSGAPGGGISVKMRGVTSIFSNSQPLYVVDGSSSATSPFPRASISSRRHPARVTNNTRTTLPAAWQTSTRTISRTSKY